MTDYAPSWTPRLKVKYQVAGRQHSFEVRMPRGTLAGDVPDYVEKVETFLTNLAGLRFTDWLVISAEYALTDSDIFLPITAPAPSAGTANPAGRLATTNDVAVRFGGRGDGGSRWSMTLFGLNLTGASSTVQDWKVFNAESADISLAYGTLSETPPNLVAIDGSELNYYNYVTVKYNDHWVGVTRNG